jgi:hypothetical protein
MFQIVAEVILCLVGWNCQSKMAPGDLIKPPLAERGHVQRPPFVKFANERNASVSYKLCY